MTELIKTSANSHSRMVLALFGALLLMRLVFLVPAFGGLIGGKGGDLEARRTELTWVAHGLDPEMARQRVLFESSAQQRADWNLQTPALLPEVSEIAVGRFADGNFSDVNPHLAAYPHWSYPLMLPLIWPPWPATNLYYAVVLLSAFAGLCWLLTQGFTGAWRQVALLVVLVPMSAYAAAVSTGQLSIPVVLVLGLFGLMVQKERWVSAGILLGLAAAKPTMTVLFAVVLLSVVVGRRASWKQAARCVAIAASIVGGASVLMWIKLGVDPLTALNRIIPANSHAASEGYGLLSVAARVFPEVDLTFAFALGGAGLATLAASTLARYPLICQFAVLGLLSRLWAYHRHYDDLLLLFLLIALLAEVRRGSHLCLGALILMAMTLATPVPASTSLELLRVGVWVVATAILVWETKAVRVDGAAGGHGRPMTSLVEDM